MNVMNEFIELTKRHITEYAELTFNELLDEEIFAEYLELYINTRYYNIADEQIRFQLKNKLLRALGSKKEKLIIHYPEKQISIEQLLKFYEYVLYLDDVIITKNIEKVIDDLYEFKTESLEIEDEKFKEKLSKMRLINKKHVNKFFKDLETEDFFLKLSYYQNINNVQRVNLKYNFEISLYSSAAVESVINKGNINEDKLFVEYYLVTSQVIKDIIKGNFHKQYIVEFAETLFKKPKKILKVLDVIKNVAIQDKLSLKIRYNAFLQNKDKVYNLMRSGYRIAIILDEKYEFKLEELEKLNVFKFVFIKFARDHF